MLPYLRALEDRIVCQAGTIAEVAQAIGADPEVLEATVSRWNALVADAEDADHGRPPPSMLPIRTPPFHFAPVWPIPRLYAAGELGGVFGHLYLAGGNMAECFIGGWIAGRETGALERWG